MTRAVAPRNVNAVFAGLPPPDIYTTQEVVALSSGLPVGSSSGSQIRTLARIVVPVAAGDVLELAGRQRVTNDIGPKRYPVGIGYWWDVYDVDDGVSTSSADKLWTRVGSLDGQNVDRSIVHHLPLTLVADIYQIPSSWPAGHRIAVAFRADAHSSGWNDNGGNDKITVDDYGVITVRHYPRG